MILKFKKDQVLHSNDPLDNLLSGGESLLLVREDESIEITSYTREFKDVDERISSFERGGPLVARRYFVEEQLRNESNPKKEILLQYELTQIDRRLEEVG